MVSYSVSCCNRWPFGTTFGWVFNTIFAYFWIPCIEIAAINRVSLYVWSILEPTTQQTISPSVNKDRSAVSSFVFVKLVYNIKNADHEWANFVVEPVPAIVTNYGVFPCGCLLDKIK